MNSKEAKQRSEESIMKLIPLQYDRIMKEIEECISFGNFVCWTNEDLYPENKQKLIDNGFKVKYSGGSYSNYKISWEDEKPVKKNRFAFWKR